MNFCHANANWQSFINSNSPGCQLKLHREAPNTTHSYWMISILTANPADRDPLRDHLREKGIETRPLFYPAHTMPMYRQHGTRYPVAEDLSQRGINLPSWPGLTDEQLKTIVSADRGLFCESS